MRLDVLDGGVGRVVAGSSQQPLGRLVEGFLQRLQVGRP